MVIVCIVVVDYFTVVTVQCTLQRSLLCQMHLLWRPDEICVNCTKLCQIVLAFGGTYHLQ